MSGRSSARDAGSRGTSVTRWLVLLAIVVVAAGLRIFRLGAWPLAGDEIFTLRDSLTGYSLSGPKPLLFFLNHYLVAPWHALDEVGLRILPVVFGIAAVPGMYFATRPVLGSRAALITAALTAVAPWHVYWSQFARYYSLVFFFTGVSGFLVYLGVERRELKLLVAGAALWPLAALAHPSAVLVLGGLALWALWMFRTELRESGAFGRIQVVGAAAVGLVLLVAGVWKFGPVLRAWFVWDHDWGHGPLALVLSYVDHVTLSVTILAAAGTIWLIGHDRDLALFTILAVVVPVGAAAVTTLGVPVSTGYLFATLPFVLAATGHLLDRLWEHAASAGGAVGYASICLAVIVLADSGSKLIAHYQDGGRPDFRSAARVIEERAAPGDIVLSDQRDVTRHYLETDIPVRTFFRTDTLPEIPSDGSVAGGSEARLSSRPEAIWLMVEIRRRGGFNEKDLGPAAGWVWDLCRQTGSFGHSRLDYKVNRVRLYRCPAPLRKARDRK